MQIIHASLHDSITILLTFAFDLAVNAKIKAIPGWAYNAKRWTVPIRRLDDLCKTFGDSLTIDAAVLEAKHENDLLRVRTFVDNLLAAGISLNFVNGRVIGSGGVYVPDPWQREIDARADKIIALGLQNAQAPQRAASHRALPALPVDVSAELLRQSQILVTGFRNAARNEQKDAAQQKARRRKSKTKQAAAEPA